MHKIIEIPIYALDEKTLRLKYDKYVEVLRREVWSNTKEDTFQRCLEVEAYPERVWDYNHIVGYIAIGYEFGDVLYKVYLPTPKKQRYMWKSSKKTFLCDIHTNGTHFRIEKDMNNQKVQSEIKDMLNSVIEEHIPRKYYVDRQAFDNVNDNIDYLKVFKEVDAK